MLEFSLAVDVIDPNGIVSQQVGIIAAWTEE